MKPSGLGSSSSRTSGFAISNVAVSRVALPGLDFGDRDIRQNLALAPSIVFNYEPLVDLRDQRWLELRLQCVARISAETVVHPGPASFEVRVLLEMANA